MPFVVGETIGPYRILEQLGRGGMATVFKAYHASLDRYVAIKALHPAFMEDPNFHKRFQREARVVAKLEHPNIVPIYDFSEYENRPYLVMKYITGDTLKARLRAGSLEQDELLHIVKSIGAGMAYAHKQGILHRDIKPSNVLLADDGRVYLADFGLARIAQAGESTLSSDMMLGTPQYISPEQAMGLSDLDERTDIYSFGVMLYEMVVGQAPFNADTPFSIIHDHIYTPLPLPHTIKPDISEGVERVLFKALAKDRADRYASSDDLVAAFTQAISAQDDPAAALDAPLPAGTAPTLKAERQSEPVQTPISVSEALPQDDPVSESPPEDIPLPSDESSAKPARRRRPWWQIALAVVALLVCGVLTVGVLSSQNDEIVLNPDMSLAEAAEQANENPDDPYAWLQLAGVSWEEGLVDGARSAFDRALEAAGDDENFYFSVAASLADEEVWGDAARIYLRGIQRFYPDGNLPPEIQEAFHEAVYWATASPDFKEIIFIEDIAGFDPAMAQITKARLLFVRDQGEEAHSLTEQVILDIEPSMPEAHLLMVEILFSWGASPAAQPYLNALLSDDNTPAWIRAYAETFADTMQKSIDEALAEVEADPENPWLHLNLFDVYLASGQHEQARNALRSALEFSGDDPAILESAADSFSAYSLWVEAAKLYSHAAQIFPENERPIELMDKFVQALYYSAADENALDLFSTIQDMPDTEANNGSLRPIFRDILIARHTLYYGAPDEARALIDDVVARAHTNLPLAHLVQGEIYLYFDDPAGEVILRELLAVPALPVWMEDKAQWLLDANN